MNKVQHRIGPAWINTVLLGIWLAYTSIETVHATATDYAEWKVRQQQHDARLKKKIAAATPFLKTIIIWLNLHYPPLQLLIKLA